MEAGRERSVLWAALAALAVTLAGTLLIATVPVSGARWVFPAAPALHVAAVASRGSQRAACEPRSALAGEHESQQGSPLLPLFAFFLPLSHVPVPIEVEGLDTVGEVARAATRELALAAKLGRAVTAADVRLFIISREEAKRLLANSSRAVPDAEKGEPLGALDSFDAVVLCEGSCLLLELSSSLFSGAGPNNTSHESSSTTIAPPFSVPRSSALPVAPSISVLPQASSTPREAPLPPAASAPMLLSPFPRAAIAINRVVVVSIFVKPMAEMMKLHIALLLANLRHPLIYAAVNNGFSDDFVRTIAADTESMARHFGNKLRIIAVPKPVIADSNWKCDPHWPSCDHGTKTVAAVDFLQTDLNLAPSDVLWTLDADMFLLTELHFSPEQPGKTWNVISVIFNRRPVPQPDDRYGAGERTACGPGKLHDCDTYYSYLWPNFALFAGFSGAELKRVNFRPGFSDSGSMTEAFLQTPGLAVVKSRWAGHDATVVHPWKLTIPDDSAPWTPAVDQAFVANEPENAANFCFSPNPSPHCRFVTEQIAIMNAGAGCVRFSGLLIPDSTSDQAAFVYHLGSAASNWRGCDEHWMSLRLADLRAFFLQQHPDGLDAAVPASANMSAAMPSSNSRQLQDCVTDFPGSCPCPRRAGAEDVQPEGPAAARRLRKGRLKR